MKGSILIVEDEADMRDLLQEVLTGTYTVTTADTGAALKQAFTAPQPDVILLDLKLPDADGLELLPQIKKQWPDTQVIVLTGNATFDAAIKATKLGAYHFLSKPFETQGLLVTVDRAIEHRRQGEENDSLHKAVSVLSGGSSPVFHSASMKEVVRTIQRVAPSDVPIRGRARFVPGSHRIHEASVDLRNWTVWVDPACARVAGRSWGYRSLPA